MLLLCHLQKQCGIPSSHDCEIIDRAEELNLVETLKAKKLPVNDVLVSQPVELDGEGSLGDTHELTQHTGVNG